MRVIGLRKAPELGPQYIEVTVKEAIVLSPKEIADKDIKPNQYIEMRLSLAESIKSDSGSFSVEIEGVSYRFAMAPRGKLGVDVDALEFTYRYGTGEGQQPLKPFDFARRLSDKKVKITSARNRPVPPTRDRLLEDIRNQLNLIRLDAIRRR